jgi:phosphatidylglycerol---prolipoprotein diacylglyceryl transferase
MATSFGCMAALAMLVLLVTANLCFRNKGIPYRTGITFSIFALVLSFVCSRLLFTLSNLPLYVNTLGNPALMLRFWDGGASLLGALLGVLLSGALTARLFRLSCGKVMDCVALSAPLSIAIERLGEGYFDEIMGKGKAIETEFLSFLGSATDGNHPVFLYEAAAMVIILMLLIGSRRKRKPDGDTMLLFLLVYGCVQVVLESLRNDSHMLLIHFVRVNQIGALVLAVAAIVCWTVRVAREGSRNHLIIGCWIAVIAAIGVGIGMEFAIDRLGMPLLCYCLMMLAMLIIAGSGLMLRRAANEAELQEEV